MTWTPEFLVRNSVETVGLGRRTTMRIGGSAELVSLRSVQDVEEALAVRPCYLGKGANLLISDDGVPGPVVTLDGDFVSLEVLNESTEEVTLRVGGGLDLAKFIGTCVSKGWAGPEGLAGVPASIGGAVFMNAGTPTCWMGDFLTRVQVALPGSSPQWFDAGDLKAGYRTGGVPTGGLVTSIEVALQRGDPSALKATATALKQKKAASQPLAARSAGCIFTNPSPENPAGKLVDECGLKGSRVGGASVSMVHGNFIINDEQGSAADVCALIRQVRRRVWDERGIVLTLEVQTWNCPDDLNHHPQEYTL